MTTLVQYGVGALLQALGEPDGNTTYAGGMPDYLVHRLGLVTMMGISVDQLLNAHCPKELLRQVLIHEYECVKTTCERRLEELRQV